MSDLAEKVKASVVEALGGDDEGGPAFPIVITDSTGHQHHIVGMSLRDWFAGKALAAGWQEFLASGDAWDGYGDFADSCYTMADAMLKAREGK